jgi:hypothetical protein
MNNDFSDLGGQQTQQTQQTSQATDFSDLGGKLSNSTNQSQGTNLEGTVQKAFDNPVGNAVNFLAPAIQSNLGAVGNVLDYQSKQQRPENFGQAVSNAASATGNLVTQLPKVAWDDAMTILGAKGLKQVVTHPIQTATGVTQAISQVPKYFTKGGVANLADQAASKATQAGQSIHWDDLMAQAKAKVIKQFGDNAAVRKALSNVISPRVPSGIDNPLSTVQQAKGGQQISPMNLVKALLEELKTTPDKAISPIDEAFSSGTKPIAAPRGQNPLQQTPTDLLAFKRNLLASYGKNIIQVSSDSGLNALEQKIAGVVRGTVADNLHRVAPGTIMPDKLYSLYAKKGPQILSVLKSLGIPIGLIGGGLVGAETLNAFGKSN